MRDLEKILVEALREDSTDVDPTARHRVLNTLARISPDVPKPVFGVMRGWVTVAAAAALSVTIVMFGSELARTQFGEHSSHSSVFASPDGMRLVGRGQVVVAVPAAWTNWQPSCGEPGHGYVFFEPVAAIRCRAHAAGDAVPSLGIADSSTEESRQLIQTMEPVGEINGLIVMQDEEKCSFDSDGVCARHFAIPAEGVLFTVQTLDVPEASEIFAEIRDSVRPLPDGFTTVPYRDTGIDGSTGRAAAQLMELNGLDVKTIETPSEGRPRGILLSISPVPGSPVRHGETVTLTVTEETQP